MQYKTVGFSPQIPRENPTESTASALDSIIVSHANEGWEFVGVQNHSVVVPGSSGCFGFGASAPYPKTLSMAVFRK